MASVGAKGGGEGALQVLWFGCVQGVNGGTEKGRAEDAKEAGGDR